MWGKVDGVKRFKGVVIEWREFWLMFSVLVGDSVVIERF